MKVPLYYMSVVGKSIGLRGQVWEILGGKCKPKEVVLTFVFAEKNLVMKVLVHKK